jgi:hypothetical protein
MHMQSLLTADRRHGRRRTAGYESVRRKDCCTEGSVVGLPSVSKTLQASPFLLGILLQHLIQLVSPPSPGSNLCGVFSKEKGARQTLIDDALAASLGSPCKCAIGILTEMPVFSHPPLARQSSWQQFEPSNEEIVLQQLELEQEQELVSVTTRQQSGCFLLWQRGLIMRW